MSTSGTEGPSHGSQASSRPSEGDPHMDTSSPPIRVLIVDDQTLFRVGLAHLLEADPVANRVLEMLTGSTTPKEFYDGLTTRELEILKLLASGMANKQIAYQLSISEKTVRNHVSNMYEKLNVYDRTQAALYAVRKGLIEL